jgi:hypothetical protein
MDGYEVTCSVENRSSSGIAEVAVRLRIHSGGDMECDGERTSEATVFARQAVAATAAIRIHVPHIVRFPLGSFSTDADRGTGFSATVYWRDDDGRRWKRTDGGRAIACRARDYPALSAT